MKFDLPEKWDSLKDYMGTPLMLIGLDPLGNPNIGVYPLAKSYKGKKPPTMKEADFYKELKDKFKYQLKEVVQTFPTKKLKDKNKTISNWFRYYYRDKVGNFKEVHSVYLWCNRELYYLNSMSPVTKLNESYKSHYGSEIEKIIASFSCQS